MSLSFRSMLLGMATVVISSWAFAVPGQKGVNVQACDCIGDSNCVCNSAKAGTNASKPNKSAKAAIKPAIKAEVNATKVAKAEVNVAKSTAKAAMLETAATQVAITNADQGLEDIRIAVKGSNVDVKVLKGDFKGTLIFVERMDPAVKHWSAFARDKDGAVRKGASSQQGPGSLVRGSDNQIYGKNNVIDGSGNTIEGSNVSIKGSNVSIKGSNVGVLVSTFEQSGIKAFPHEQGIVKSGKTVEKPRLSEKKPLLEPNKKAIGYAPKGILVVVDGKGIAVSGPDVEISVFNADKPDAKFAINGNKVE